MSLQQAATALLASEALGPALWCAVASFLGSLLLVSTQRLHGPWTLDSVHGVQKFHSSPTPRVGGMPIFLALVLAWYLAPREVGQLLGPLLVAGLPALLFGLAEDTTKRVGVMPRLVATIASGLLACWAFGQSLTRVDVWGVDWLLSFSLASVVFTAFAVAGVANALNIIDGLNGLASSAATYAFVGVALIGWQVGDRALAGMALMLAFVVMGFFFVNWPFGKLFLGDGGAYFVGFSLAWAAVLLVERNASVPAFSALILCTLPVIEVVFSIVRRRVRRQHPGMPDRMHLHSLVKRIYVRRWLRGWPPVLQNSAAGLAVGAMSIPAVLVAFLVQGSAGLALAAFLGLACGYCLLYWAIIYRRRVGSNAFPSVRPDRGAVARSNEPRL